MDLKPNNIVILHSSEVFKPYLIDFGLTIKINKFFNLLISGYASLDANYVFWPPELRMLSIDFLSPMLRKNTIDLYINKNNADILSNYYNQFNIYLNVYGISRRVLIMDSGRSELNTDLTTYLTKIFSFLWSTNQTVTPLELKNWLDIDYNSVREWLNRFNINPRIIEPKDLILPPGSAIEVFIKKILACVDAFSLGIVLSFIFKKLIGIYSNNLIARGYMIYYLNNPVMDNAFTNELYVNLVVPFERITSNLLNFRFTERMTVEQALVEFKALLPVFKTYISRKEFYDFYIARGMDEEKEVVSPNVQSPL
jgi:hypothetical protein